MPASTPSLREQDQTLLKIIDANFADAAQRSGPHLVCRPGCTQCCHGAFAISPLDAYRLREAMAALTATDPQKSAQLTQRANAYIAEFAATFPGDPTTGILDETEAARRAFEDFANEAPCPALDPVDGTCDLYEARPMTCRIFGPPLKVEIEPASTDADLTDPPPTALATCELCFTTATPEAIADAEMRLAPNEEEQVLQSLQSHNPSAQGETLVAWCLR